MARARKSKLPGMRATKDARIPVCSVCKTALNMRRNDTGEWTCFKCADDWLGEYVEAKTRHKSKGGVELPVGVLDERREKPSFLDVYPNRRSRRIAARYNRGS